MKLRLSDAERERYGVAELLDVDLKGITLAQAEDLYDATGLAVDDVIKNISEGKPAVRGGKPVLDDEGKPAVEVDHRAWCALFWLAVRAAGVDVEWADFRRHYRYRQAGYQVEPADLGKAPTPDTPGGDGSTTPST